MREKKRLELIFAEESLVWHEAWGSELEIFFI